MRLDLTVTLGSIIQIAAMIVALFTVYVLIRERLVSLETKLEPIWEWWNQREPWNGVERRRT